MKKYIQSYHAFLPGRYMRWIIYLVYPAVLLILGGVVFFFGLVYTLALPFMMMYFECVVDMFVFGGFAARENVGRMEYVKASVEGRGVVRRALIFDGVRRLLYMAAMTAVCYVAYCMEGGGELETILVWIFLCLMSATGLLTSIVLWIIRLVDNRAVQVVALYLVGFVPLCAVALVPEIAGGWNVSFRQIFVACFLGYGISVIGQIWFLMKRMREGYYDR